MTTFVNLGEHPNPVPSLCPCCAALCAAAARRMLLLLLHVAIPLGLAQAYPSLSVMSAMLQSPWHDFPLPYTRSLLDGARATKPGRSHAGT
jgi:hypothetical protein